MNESIQENIIIYDWLSFSSKIHTVRQIKEIIGFADVTFQEIYGFYGYKKRITYEGVSILYDGYTPDMGVMVDMSGQGCRTFETLGTGDWESLFELIKRKQDKKHMNISRLDIAYDDHEAILDIAKISVDTESGYYISKARNFEVINSNKGKTVVHGSKSSGVFIRIYDKAKERGHADGRHWVRLELQLRDKNALGFIQNETAIGKKFRGVVYNYLRYVIPTENDKNKRRWSDTAYWQKFIQSAEKIRIYQKPGIEYNEKNLETFVLKNSGNSINVFRKIYGDNNLILALDLKDNVANYSIKQQKLMEKYKGKSEQVPAIVSGYQRTEFSRLTENSKFKEQVEAQ